VNPKPEVCKNMTDKLRAHLLLLAVVAVWGSTFVLVKDALNDISPLLFNLIRMALATVCLAVVYGKHLRRITFKTLLGGAVAGFFLAVGYQFQTAGLARTTPSKSAFLTGLTVIIVPLLSVIPALRVPGALRPGWNAYLGALVALLGITLMTAPSLFSHSMPANGGGINVGDVLTLGCALSFALHLISLAHFAKRIPFELLALLQIGFCTVVMAVSSPILEHPRIHFSPRLVMALLVAAILATAVAFTVQSWAQQHLAATHTALILSAEPLFAWITSLIFLHQGLSRPQTVGALLILAGMGLTEFLTAPVQTGIAIPH
jgi:drug/metabolite transporter (DMT)-like permease